MTTTNSYKTGAARATRALARTAALLGTVAALSLPVFAYAATYAYVNQAGEVRTVEAATWDAAIRTAPSIDEHSGVMLITSPSDAVVGDSVSGV